MRRALPLLLLAACDEQEVFTTVQPAGLWVDALGHQVTSGPDLEFIDSRGVVWAIDWRTGQPAAPYAWPRTIYLQEGCKGTGFPEATAPPLHAIAKPDGTFAIAQPSASVQTAAQAWVDLGDRCAVVPGGATVYSPSSILDLRGVPRTGYTAPLRKILPEEPGKAP